MTLKVSQTVRELYISTIVVDSVDKARVRAGCFDNTTVMQVLARFEADTVERCALAADEAPVSLDSNDAIVAAIRSLTTGD